MSDGPLFRYRDLKRDGTLNEDPLQELAAEKFQSLQEWEQTMIISSLQRVAQMMDAEHIDASPVLDVGILDRQTTALDKPEAYPDRIEKQGFIG